MGHHPDEDIRDDEKDIIHTNQIHVEESDYDDEADEEYQKFVRSLNDMVADLDDIGEDEASFHGSDNEEDDEEEDDDEDIESNAEIAVSSNELNTSVSDQVSFENCFNSDGMLNLERELEMLLEEDFETALASVDLPLLFVEKNDANQLHHDQDSSTSTAGTLTSAPISSPLHKKSVSQSPNKTKMQSQQKKQIQDRSNSCHDKSTFNGALTDSQGGGSVITHAQIDDLRQLLQMHFQLLVQQAVLATRSASYLQRKRERDRSKSISTSDNEQQNIFPFHTQQPISVNSQPPTVPQMGITSENYIGVEVPDDLVEILDASVGMLQELDQNRQDAIRKLIQSENGSNKIRSIIRFDNDSLGNSTDESKLLTNSTQQRRLTRAAFQQTLQSREDFQEISIEKSASTKSRIDASDSVTRLATTNKNQEHFSHDDSCFSFSSTQNCDDRRTMSVFDMRGLSRLKEAFSHLDNCSGSIQLAAKLDNILSIPSHGDACESLLKRTGANVIKALVPGRTELTELFSNMSEISENSSSTSLNENEKLQLMRDRSTFTSSEDNLVLRGVNLFGEKEWVLIADRFLPDRSQSLVNQRHSSLTLNIFRNNGIEIDTEGNLANPPDYPDGIPLSVKHKMECLKPVSEPYTHNVHRWSIEEDVTLLKAVPIMGRLWAEISNNFIPHRDRGHLRKRYQVLERRVKAVIKRGGKKKALSVVTSNRNNNKTKPKLEGKPSLFLGESEQSKRRGVGRRRTDKMDMNFPFAMPPPMQMIPGMPYPMPPIGMGMHMGFPQPCQIIQPSCLVAKSPARNLNKNPTEKNATFNIMSPGVTFKQPVPFSGQSNELPSERNVKKKNTHNDNPNESNSCLGFQKLLEVDQDQWSNMSHIGTMSQPSHMKFETIEHDGLEGSRILTSLSIDSPGASLMSVLGDSKFAKSDDAKNIEPKGADRTKALFQVLAQATNMEASTLRSARPVSGSLTTPVASPARRTNQIMTPNSLPQVATVGSFTTDNVEFSNIQFSERSRLALDQSILTNPANDATKTGSEEDDFYDSAVLLFNLSSPAKKKLSEPSPSPRRRKRSLFGSAVNKPPQDSDPPTKRSLFASAIGSVQEKKGM